MKNLEKLLGLKFRPDGPIRTAFIHKSFLNENSKEDLMHNERLEFLGDAVLELCATHYLFENYPQQQEGEMTSYRSALVKGDHLAEVAKNLSLGAYLHLSKGEEKSGGREKNYILANTLEALIGAIYLEHGYQEAEKFIHKFILAKLDRIIDQGLHIDAKSFFQERAQEIYEVTPHYELLSESGPDHNKVFQMGAYIREELFGTGEGSSKQKAEDEAAKDAIKSEKWQQIKEI